MTKIKTLVIGANQEFATSLHEYFQPHPHILLMGIEQELVSGLQRIRESPPDLVLVDCVYIDVDASELLQKIRAVRQHTKIYLLTIYEDPVYVESAIAHGADGVIPRMTFAESFEYLMRKDFADTLS